MLHSAIKTFVQGTDWGDLDYLIIDMPPGTGDIALSLSQLLPLTGTVIVCTPQEVALIDAIKAVGMFRKVKIPVLGLIENMSSFICPDNGKQYDIFGKGGAKKYAAEDNIEFLGDIPINIQLRERGDAGEMAANFADEDVARLLPPALQQLSDRREHEGKGEDEEAVDQVHRRRPRLRRLAVDLLPQLRVVPQQRDRERAHREAHDDDDELEDVVARGAREAALPRDAALQLDLVELAARDPPRRRDVVVVAHAVEVGLRERADDGLGEFCAEVVAVGVGVGHFGVH